MNEAIQFLTRHGPTLLFAAVFLGQLGLPIPAVPLLLASGALAAAGKMSLVVAIAAAAFGSILADAIWFYLGRYHGARVLKVLCQISLEPDSCVRKTQNVFTRYGMRGVILAKFLPGLSTLAPPLAGSSGVTPARFFFFDGIGSLLYVASFLFLGILFSDQLERVISALASLGGSALVVVIGFLTLYISYKIFKRRQLIRELRMARITVDELYRQLEAGETPVILDVRALADVESEAVIIRGAWHMTFEEVEVRHHEIPRDRDIVLYCSCPNEASAAHAALILRRKGIMRVRPLLGGMDAWRERNYPIEPIILERKVVAEQNMAVGLANRP